MKPNRNDQWSLKELWKPAALVYLLLMPVILITPVSVFRDYPFAPMFTDWVATLVPMIDRITAYRNPSPDFLRFVWAFSWVSLPVLIFVVYPYAKREPRKKIPSKVSPLVLELNGLLMLFILFMFIWFWPNTSLINKEVLGSLDPHWDVRRFFFSTRISIAICTPLIMLGLAYLVAEFIFAMKRVSDLSKANQ